MAVGINGDSSKWTVNLTKLRNNIRKHPDKTSRLKRPRLGNVQVVAAGEADDEVTAALHAAVSTTTKQTVAAMLPCLRQHPQSVRDRTSVMHAAWKTL